MAYIGIYGGYVREMESGTYYLGFEVQCLLKLCDYGE